MARYRTIKPELFADEKLSVCSRDARLLFIGLLPFCDDMGRAQFSPKRIKLQVFPGDDDVSPDTVECWVQELAEAGVLRLYQYGRQVYLWIPHFLRHQRIDRPSHTDLPAHPDDTGPECICFSCKEHNNGDLRHSRSRVHASVPAGTPRRKLDERSSNKTRGENVPLEVGSVSRKTYTPTAAEQNPEPPAEQPEPEPETRDHQVETRAENRRAEFAALTEIASKMLQLLEIPPNVQILDTLRDSIRINAKSRGVSLELSGQGILARAAYLSTESPPESWLQWFDDARYEYVQQGDKRLSMQGVRARPVCGGKLCSEGWEPYTVNGARVLRRCPDCVRLWEE